MQNVWTFWQIRSKRRSWIRHIFLYARVDTIVRHPELFEKWASIGLKQVFVGMEDCSDERLAKMKKRGNRCPADRSCKHIKKNWGYDVCILYDRS